MKKKMEKAVVEVIKFDKQDDIVTTSVAIGEQGQQVPED